MDEKRSIRSLHQMYLVEFTDGSSPFFTKNSVGFKDMIIQLADSTSANCPLFIKALKGLSEESDIVALYNLFSTWEVSRILKIESVPYEKGRVSDG